MCLEFLNYKLITMKVVDKLDIILPVVFYLCLVCCTDGAHKISEVQRIIRWLGSRKCFMSGVLFHTYEICVC